MFCSFNYLSATHLNWKNTLKQNYTVCVCKCNLLKNSFSVLSWRVLRSRQIKFLLMYVHVLVFYIVCSLTYLHKKNLYVWGKNYHTCIPREHKPFWQLNWLYEFAINAISNPSRSWKIQDFSRIFRTRWNI